MTTNQHRIALRGLLFSMVLWCLVPVYGALRDGATDSMSVTFLFDLSESRIRLDYADNAGEYRVLSDFVSSLGDPSGYVVRLTISSSPDGPKWLDRKFCHYRAQNTQQYLKAALPSFFNDSTNWQIEYRYANWSELIDVLHSTDVYGKDEVLTILRGSVTPDKSNIKEELKALNDGLTWSELEDFVMPSLRYARVCVYRGVSSAATLSTSAPSEAALPAAVSAGRDAGVVINPDSIPPELLAAIIRALEAKGIQAPSTDSTQACAYSLLQESDSTRSLQSAYSLVAFDQDMASKSDGYQFALKTNLLFDVVTALNLELEFPIKNRVSILGEAVFPWWVCSISGQYYALQMMHASIECRYWFGDRTTHPLLQGWFAGIYAASTIYDFEWQNRGIQGESYIHGGVTAGYSFQVAPNWRIETSIGIGYMPNQYREYDHRVDLGLLVWQRNGSYNWIGPTKLKCSVSWLIPSYSKKQKGGER